MTLRGLMCAMLALALSVTIPFPAWAAEPPVARTGDGRLDESVDTESKDSSLKLRALEHEVYATQQYVYLSLFRQQFAGRITADRVNIANVDAGQLPVYVFAPAQLISGRSYPGLVIVHGGYYGSLDPDYFGLIEAAVTRGYIVVFPEYRGSRGYGAARYNAVDFGGKEVDDIVSAAEYLSETRPVARNRVGIYGRSKGGMIASLAIERFPKRFAAAADVVGLTDMVAYMAYKPGYRGSDVARQPRFGGKTIAQDATPYIDISPLNHVQSIETPLIVHSTTGDKTAPVQIHAGRLIELLKAYGKPHESKIYDNAPGGHLYSQTDTPQAQDSQQLILSFFDKHLHPSP